MEGNENILVTIACYFFYITTNDFSDISDHIMKDHPGEVFKFKRLTLCERQGAYGYTIINYNFRPIDIILSGKTIFHESPIRYS